MKANFDTEVLRSFESVRVASGLVTNEGGLGDYGHPDTVSVKGVKTTSEQVEEGRNRVPSCRRSSRSPPMRIQMQGGSTLKECDEGCGSITCVERSGTI